MIIAKINEISIKFIGCESCGYPKSYQLPEMETGNSFKWHCPMCGQLWIGELNSKLGEIKLDKIDEIKTETASQFILIKLDKNLFPIILMTAKAIQSGDEPNMASFRLELEEINRVSNPNGFPQFHTVEMIPKPSTRRF